MSPIRVFVGASANDEDLEQLAVLHHSIRRHASQPVDITAMRLSRDPASPWFSDGSRGWQTEAWTTPFSGFRWALPGLCGFEGRAIYCDADVIFTADIADLWRQEFEPGKAVMGTGGGSPRLCVSLWDCAAARDHVLPLADLRSSPAAHQIMTDRVKAGAFVQAFAGDWNAVDGFGYDDLADPRIKALHYSNIAVQPSHRHSMPRLAREGLRHWYDGRVAAHPRADLVRLFDDTLAEAVAAEPLDVFRAPLFGAYRKRTLINYRADRKAA